ncbi:hypothetical protein LTR41_011499 [Exophiala xenobiotica]|nr:hypothetical protein LTR41_011499 [Exophiala xenobiotica]KAK5550712.1 hypothetical protein LTR46_011289 [Exophiala xenobiotica]
MDLLNDAKSPTSTAQSFHETPVPNVERIVRPRREKSSWQIYQCQPEKQNLEEVLEILDGMEKMAALEGPQKQHTLSNVASIKSRVSQAVNFLDGTRTVERPPLVFVTHKRESLDSILQTLQSDCQGAIQPSNPPVSSQPLTVTTGQGASVLHAAGSLVPARSPTGLQHLWRGSMTQGVASRQAATGRPDGKLGSSSDNSSRFCSREMSDQGSVLSPLCVRKRPRGAMNDIVDHECDEGEVPADRPGQPAVAGKKHEDRDLLPVPSHGGSGKRHQRNAGIITRQARIGVEHLSPQEMLQPASKYVPAPGLGRHKSTMTIHPHLDVARRTITPWTSSRHLGGSGDNLQARHEAPDPVATAHPAQQHRSGPDSHQVNTRTIIVKKDLLQRCYWEFPDSLRLREGGYLTCVAGSCAIGFAASHEDIPEHYQRFHPEMPPEKYDSTLHFYPVPVIRQYEMVHGLGSAGVPSLYCTIKDCKDDGPYHAMKQLREHCYSSHGIQMRSPLRRKIVKGNIAWTHLNGTFAVVFDQHDRGGLLWIMNSGPAQRFENQSLSAAVLPILWNPLELLAPRALPAGLMELLGSTTQTLGLVAMKVPRDRGMSATYLAMRRRRDDKL